MDASSRRKRHGGKRRKTSAPAAATINDLTDDTLCHVANYLPRTSIALLAVALTAPSSSWEESGWKGEPSAASKALISSAKPGASFGSIVDDMLREAEVEAEALDPMILIGPRAEAVVQRRYLKLFYRQSRLGENDDSFQKVFRKALTEQLNEYYAGKWEVMDFCDIEMSLASKLTDVDIGAILVCIGAKENLKRLKLTHCINVVGHGLEPLRSSKVLEKLDAGLVRTFEQPSVYTDRERPACVFDKAKLSVDFVCDILVDILSTEVAAALHMVQQQGTIDRRLLSA